MSYLADLKSRRRGRIFRQLLFVVVRRKRKGLKEERISFGDEMKRGVFFLHLSISMIYAINLLLEKCHLACSLLQAP